MYELYLKKTEKIKKYKKNYYGKEQIVNVLQKNDMFPHQGLFRKGNYPAHAEIIENAKLINIPIASFENFLITTQKLVLKCFVFLAKLLSIYKTDLKKRF